MPAVFGTEIEQCSIRIQKTAPDCMTHARETGARLYDTETGARWYDTETGARWYDTRCRNQRQLLEYVLGADHSTTCI